MKEKGLKFKDKTSRYYQFGILVVAAIMLSTIVMATLINTEHGNYDTDHNNQYVSGLEVDYLITTDGTYSYLFNGTDGKIDQSSTNFSYIFQYALDNIGENSTLKLKGVFYATYGVEVDVSKIIIDLGASSIFVDDTYSPLNRPLIKLIDGNEQITIKGGFLHGNNDTLATNTITAIYDDCHTNEVTNGIEYRDVNNKVLYTTIKDFGGDGLFVKARRGLYIGVEVFQVQGYGFHINIGSDHSFYDCTAQECGDGWLVAASWCHMYHCIAQENIGQGMYLTGPHIKVYGGYSEHNGNRGILTGSSVVGMLTIKDMYIGGNYFGIHIQSHNTTIEGVHFRDNEYGDIVTSGLYDDIILKDNNHDDDNHIDHYRTRCLENGLGNVSVDNPGTSDLDEWDQHEFKGLVVVNNSGTGIYMYTVELPSTNSDSGSENWIKIGG